MILLSSNDLFIGAFFYFATVKKILIIQTAFIGDVVLATAVVEKLRQHFPDAGMDFLLRKGNENILEGHPHIRKIWVWDKRSGKLLNWLKLLVAARRERYDLVVNLHRFISSGLFTVLSDAKTTTGFDKNPLSILFTQKVSHRIGEGSAMIHEVDRNLSLIAAWTDSERARPKIYLTAQDYGKHNMTGKYITISPASIWKTKQYPSEKWVSFMDRVGERTTICLLGSPADVALCEAIRQKTRHPNTVNLAGQLTLRESAALMTGAVMNYTNDSAPLHLATAVNAPVTAVFCSTVPSFGFGPLSDISFVLETTEKLSCRPCGLHGKNACPQGHFKCAGFELPTLLQSSNKST